MEILGYEYYLMCDLGDLLQEIYNLIHQTTLKLKAFFTQRNTFYYNKQITITE